VAAVATAPSETTVARLDRAARLFEAGGRTLEDLVLERWDELIASGRAECPVCGGRLHAAGGCDGCGSELA
jgi:tRNA(Ile2) C34 agmatinyltransferase TiaS